jgi:hypothetical protein
LGLGGVIQRAGYVRILHVDAPSIATFGGASVCAGFDAKFDRAWEGLRKA